MARRIRVVWLSLWFGSLTSNYLRIIEGDDFECKLITSLNHLDPNRELFCNSYCIEFSKSRVFRIFELLKVVKEGFKTHPDLLIIDISPRAPILIAQLILAIRFPVLVTVHDPIPHDDQHRISGLSGLLSRLLLSRARGAITFSKYSSQLLKDDNWLKPVFNLPLLPEVATDGTEFKTERANFAMIGRWSYYKGFDIGLEIWQKFQEFSDSNEILDLWLSGAPHLTDLPEKVVVRSTDSFSWGDLMSALPFYRAVLMPYRSATQSGVQVLAWSLGVPCLVSSIDGFAQYQLPAFPGISIHNLDEWVGNLFNLLETDYDIDLGERGKQFLMSEINPQIVKSKFREIVKVCK